MENQPVNIECECGEEIGSDYKETSNRVSYHCPKCGYVRYAYKNGKYFKYVRKEEEQ